MSKFGGQDYLLCVHEFGTKANSKNIITESAMDYANHHNIPLARRFSTRKRETGGFDLRPFEWRGQFSKLQPTSLSAMKTQDKLFVFAHADPSEVGFASARLMAGILQANGLRAVGLVTFKACKVGVGSFLEDFVASCVSRGIVIGWAKGYNGSAATVSKNGRPSERIRGNAPSPGAARPILQGDDRYKIVSSPNNPFVNSVGRYKVAQDSEDWLKMIQID